MLRDSVVIVVHRHAQAIPLAMITMRKSTHGFPFASHMGMGLRLVLTIRNYIITKSTCTLWLVNQLWFIVPVNSWKNRVSFELLYKSNRPQVSMVYRLINHLIYWKNTQRTCKSLACGSWFMNSSRFLPTSRVVYQPINHRNLWSIA